MPDEWSSLVRRVYGFLVERPGSTMTDLSDSGLFDDEHLEHVIAVAIARAAGVVRAEEHVPFGPNRYYPVGEKEID